MPHAVFGLMGTHLAPDTLSSHDHELLEVPMVVVLAIVCVLILGKSSAVIDLYV